MFLAVTLPWYIWAEIRTPGFINYFIVGEHFYRFVESGWTGDLYGTAHDQPKGSIWLFWLAAAFPWSFYLFFTAIETKRFSRVKTKYQSLVPYLLSWVVSPMLLFTMAGNVLAIYVMPGFAALAIVIALTSKKNKCIAYISSASLLLVSIVLIAVISGAVGKSSESELLGRDRSFDQNARLYYWQHRPFSAQFYSKGQAQLIETESAMKDLMAEQESFYLVLKKNEYAKFKELLALSCKEIAQSRKRIQFACN
jgi:4-amino-4-deoxy-L-arabinose transferase-like glycosyltransferase